MRNVLMFVTDIDKKYFKRKLQNEAKNQGMTAKQKRSVEDFSELGGFLPVKILANLTHTKLEVQGCSYKLPRVFSSII